MYLPPEIFELIMSFAVPHKFVGQLKFYQKFHEYQKATLVSDTFSLYLDEYDDLLKGMTHQEMMSHFRMVLNQTYDFSFATTYFYHLKD